MKRKSVRRFKEKKLRPFGEKRRKNTTKGERYYVRKLAALLRAEGAFVWIDSDTGAARTKSGFDYIVTCGSSTEFYEAKMENAPLTPFQEETRERVLSAGGKYWVTRFFPKDKAVIIYSVTGTPFYSLGHNKIFS